VTFRCVARFRLFGTGLQPTYNLDHVGTGPRVVRRELVAALLGLFDVFEADARGRDLSLF